MYATIKIYHLGGHIMSEVSTNCILVRNQDLIATDMDGDTVMMSIEHGEYYGISGVGSRIWELLEKPTSFSVIVATICLEFEVDKEKCQSDALVFIRELVDNGLALVE
jgi:hypothetical protein